MAETECPRDDRTAPSALGHQSTEHRERGTPMTPQTRDGGRRTEPRPTASTATGQPAPQPTHREVARTATAPHSEHWQAWIGEAFVQAQYALRDPRTGEVDFPQMRYLVDATGIPQETLRTYVRKGHIPQRSYVRLLARALAARGLPVNPVTVLYHAGYLALEDLVPFWSPTFVSLMTETDYREQQQAIAADVPDYLRPMMLANLDVSWRFSRYVTTVLTQAGLSPTEIAEFVEQMNTAEGRDALRSSVTGESYQRRTPPAPPQEYLREAPQTRSPVRHRQPNHP